MTGTPFRSSCRTIIRCAVAPVAADAITLRAWVPLSPVILTVKLNVPSDATSAFPDREVPAMDHVTLETPSDAVSDAVLVAFPVTVIDAPYGVPSAGEVTVSPGGSRCVPCAAACAAPVMARVRRLMRPLRSVAFSSRTCAPESPCVEKEKRNVPSFWNGTSPERAEAPMRRQDRAFTSDGAPVEIAGVTHPAAHRHRAGIGGGIRGRIDANGWS